MSVHRYTTRAMGVNVLALNASPPAVQDTGSRTLIGLVASNRPGSKESAMLDAHSGIDFHPEFQQIAFVENKFRDSFPDG